MKKENVIDLATYEVNFVTYGAEGEGKPEVDIKKVPEVANSSAEISNLLSNPDISFNKQSNLKKWWQSRSYNYTQQKHCKQIKTENNRRIQTYIHC